VVDYRNNVIYNWSDNSAYGGEAGRHNLVANYYKYGPATGTEALRKRIVNPFDSDGRWYVAGNYVYRFPEVTADNWAGGVYSDSLGTIRLSRPVPAAPVITHTAETAFQLVLADAGVVLPVRDTVDNRIIEEVMAGTAVYGHPSREEPGIIDSQTEVGGWPELRTYNVPVDADHDGMADPWEISVGLNPAKTSDGLLDRDRDGYTNLEEYLNSLCIRDNYLTAPAELSAGTVADDSVLLIWKSNSPDENGFCIERSPGDSSAFREIAWVGSDICHFSDKGLGNGQVYLYRVRAYKGEIRSLYSNVYHVTSR
jgi:hypothetical protein